MLKMDESKLAFFGKLALPIMACISCFPTAASRDFFCKYGLDHATCKKRDCKHCLAQDFRGLDFLQHSCTAVEVQNLRADFCRALTYCSANLAISFADLPCQFGRSMSCIFLDLKAVFKGPCEKLAGQLGSISFKAGGNYG